jgi:hypothetical protein
VGLNSLKSLNLTTVYPNNNNNKNKKKKNNKVKSKPLELFELAGKNYGLTKPPLHLGAIDTSESTKDFSTNDKSLSLLQRHFFITF